MRKAFGRFALMFLGALGLTSCDNILPDPVEYSCAYATYTLSGTVVDADSSKAVEGIRIDFRRANDDRLTAYSDAEGNWRISGRICCAWQDSLHVRDIDADSNRGTFMPDSLKLNPIRTTPDARYMFDEWYAGAFEQTGIHIILKKNP